MENTTFKSFGLSEELLTALDKLGYINPTEVQRRVIPYVLSNRDIIVKSQTGSGKTAAFAIPICENLELNKKKPQVLVLTPTRELALQVKEDIADIGRLKKIRCAAVFGKQPMSLQVKELKQRIHVVVGTPGRISDHIERGTLELDEIRYLVIDEGDEMLNMGFISQMEAIIEKLPENRVTMLFSATIPSEIEELCNSYMRIPENIEIQSKSLTVDKIKQLYYEVEENKLDLLYKILYSEAPDSLIIFCNTKEAVDKLLMDMQKKAYPCRALHGGMEQSERLSTMKSFKKGEFPILIATDVAARGIHIEEVTHVINYDVPFEKESYVHRIGRTGRAGSGGTAITLVCPYEKRALEEIEEYIGFNIPWREAVSEEEIARGKEIFLKKLKAKPKLKKSKSLELNKEITKLYINAGKKKKIRTGDIVGAITSIEGVTSEDIGIIDIQDNISYVDILGKKGDLVLEALQHITIKGKVVKVQRAAK